MHRFFVPHAAGNSRVLALSAEDSHHAARVLRLQPGDRVTLLDGRGGSASGQIATIARSTVSVAIESHAQAARPKAGIILAIGLAKVKAFELALQKATELGACEIHPLQCEHSVVEIPDREFDRKRAGWQKTTIEAAKQCGTPWLPDIHPPARVCQWLGRTPAPELRLVASLEPSACSIGDGLDAFYEDHGRLPERTSICIGPEGDFSAAEYDSMRQAGLVAVTLGLWVLRCDTAAIAALAILQHEFSRR